LVIPAVEVLFLIVLLFVLVSGLYVLCCRGASDLEAWGRFVSQVIRGDRVRPTPHERSDEQK
jgi:hypothetical protein